LLFLSARGISPVENASRLLSGDQVGETAAIV